MAVQAGGCILQLRQARAQQYIPAILASSNKGWQRRWFYLRNDGELLSPFSQRVVTAATDAWRHGTPHERRHRRLAPRDPAREAEKSRAPSPGSEGVAGGGTYRCGSNRRHSPSEGAPIGGAAAVALGDDPGSRLGGLTDVPGSSFFRRPPMAGVGRDGEAGPPRILPASDAPRSGVRDFGERPLLLSSYVWLLQVLMIGFLSPLLLGNLEPLLQALKELREGGLTAAGVIAAIHRRRVLPLAERRLSLWEMTPGADWEGSRMSPDPLSSDALQWRVSAAMGKPDPHAYSQLRMRPDQGCVTLVSVRSSFLRMSGCSRSL